MGVRVQNAESVLGPWQHVSCVNVTIPRFSDIGLVFPSVMMVLFLRHAIRYLQYRFLFQLVMGFPISLI